MQKPYPHEGFRETDGRRQAAHLPSKDWRLEYPERFVAQDCLGMREIPQREHGLVPTPRELARQGEEAHQVTVIATELHARRMRATARS